MNQVIAWPMAADKNTQRKRILHNCVTLLCIYLLLFSSIEYIVNRGGKLDLSQKLYLPTANEGARKQNYFHTCTGYGSLLNLRFAHFTSSEQPWSVRLP